MSDSAVLSNIHSKLKNKSEPIEYETVRALYSMASKYNTLYEVGKLILSETDIVALVKLALDKVLEVTFARRGFLALIDDKGELDFRAARNIDKNDIKDPKFQISYSIVKEVISTHQTICLPNALEDEKFSASQSVSRLRLLSVLCSPILLEDQLVGIIYVDNQDYAHIFCDATNELIQDFSSLMSVALKNAFSFHQLQESKDLMVQTLRAQYKFDHIIGSSPAMVRVLKLVSDVAATDASILIRGENGTGKELIAKALHYNSNRHDQNFVTINCAALPENLIESELFGHVKGAFTGAVANKQGKFALADKGTIFLDEIGELDANLQAKLLRVVEYGTFSPVGSSREQQCDVRIITATNRDLEDMIQKKTFRQDLYFRLNVIKIIIPPLRQRRDDIKPLALHFIEKYRPKDKTIKISPAALRVLQEYDFPGNIRQLENTIQHAVILNKSGQIDIQDLPNDILAPFGDSGLVEDEQLTFQQKKQRVIEKFEKAEIVRLLAETRGKLRRAARLAGMDAKNFSDKVKKYNVSLDEF
jgi:transcriptional regulator with GAF, ATPase, and Fis domain